jgi:hypothetical protein
VPEKLRILRERIWIMHDTPRMPSKRYIIRELTFYNDSNKKVTHIIFDIDELMLGLRIFDHDGSELSFYPKNFIRELLEPFLNEEDLNELTRPGKYTLWIPLPVGRPFEPKETRLIKLQYFDPKEVKPASWRVSAFNLPRFRIMEEKREEDYDTFFVIQAPEYYEIKYKREKAEKDGESLVKDDGFYENVYGYIVNIRIPSLKGSFINFSALYEIKPSQIERILFWISWGLLLLAASVLLILSIKPLVGLPPDLFPRILERIMQTNLHIQFAIGIAGAALTIAGLIRDPLLQRAKLYFIILAIIAIIALLLFFV